MLRRTVKRGSSYWSKRRQILRKVSSHMSDIRDYEKDTCTRNNSGTMQVVSDNSYASWHDDISHLEACNNCDNLSERSLDSNDMKASVKGSIVISLTSDSYSSENANGGCFNAECWETFSSSEFSDDSNDGNVMDLQDKLAQWANVYNPSQNSIKALLEILHTYHPNLPRDPRTLLHTPSRAISADLRKLNGGGEYFHFGVGNCLFDLFFAGHVSAECTASGILEIQVNIDGLPLYKSSGYQLWPILGQLLHCTSTEPFVVGLYGGYSKPAEVSDYLHDFIQEFKSLEADGILLGGQQYGVRIHSIVCDSPARALLKCTKGHTGYYGCDRCCQSGKWLGKMTFPELTAGKRTDFSFRAMSDEDHHLAESPLTALNVDLVQHFPLDYMHMACLGVMRRLLMAWIGKPGGSKACKLSASSLSEISQRLLSLRKHVPLEFVRKPRTLSELDRWKATEFRQVLLYTGCLVFRGILKDAVYKNFLLLHVAMRCLVSPGHSSNSEMCDYAEELLVLFVKHCIQLYGAEFIVYNVHSITHIVDDARLFGSIQNVSCFPYENHMRKLKRMVRKNNLPLQQIVNRVVERSRSLTGKTASVCSGSSALVCLCQHSKGPLHSTMPATKCKQYSQLTCQQWSVTLTLNNCCVQMNDSSIGLVRNIIMCEECIYVLVEKYSRIGNFFDYPAESSKCDIFCVSDLSGTLVLALGRDIKSKCVRLPVDDDNYLVMPLIHCM